MTDFTFACWAGSGKVRLRADGDPDTCLVDPFHASPALVFRDTLAGLHLAGLIFEVGEPALIQD